MITNIYLISFLTLAFGVSEWIRLKRRPRSTRWIMVAVIGASYAIWVYMTFGEPIFHPLMWLNDALDPYSPKAYR